MAIDLVEKNLKHGVLEMALVERLKAIKQYQSQRG
jgi:hypothetical protein